MGFIDRLKEKFTGKSKSSGRKRKDTKSTEERYGIPETGFQNNPLYEADRTEDHYGVEQFNPLFEEPQAEEQQNAEPAAPGENVLHNIGGLPDIGSIENMAGGLKLDKIGRHKDFYKALEALKAYQAIMDAPRSTAVNVFAVRQKTIYNAQNAKIRIDTEAITEACAKIADFVHYAERAVAGANGMFASRSANVRKLTPVFANLLIKAGDLMPKLAHLESAVAPYLIQTDKEQYTFSDIIHHEIMGAHAGGLVMSGFEDSNGSITLSLGQVHQAAASIRKTGKTDVLSDLRRAQAEKARMGLLIPSLPAKALLNDDNRKKSDPELDAMVEKIADQYIAELKPLMTALDDTAESYEFTGENERKGVQDQKAQSFRVSRLLYCAINNKELLKKIIIQGSLADTGEEEKSREYEDIKYLKKLGGMNLSEAMAKTNKDAMETKNFARLVDKDKNDLKVDTDYEVGGGQTSISILDYKNRRVLRAPKKKNEYISEQEQKTAMNGIRDEAAGKVAQFLGFDICAQAEAVGFKARDGKGQNETAVFGGSIMEMADGITAKYVNLTLQGKSDVYTGRSSDKFENVDLTQNGRVIEDIMKMNVLDFLIQHNDRSTNNFMINTKAVGDERRITAIDNDMILGFDKGYARVGGEHSEEALLAINERGNLDFGIKLEAACPMMTQDMKAKIAGLDIEAFNRLLMPYADRLSRMTAVHRLRELKSWAKEVPVCDLTTPEGIEEYLDVAKKKAVGQWLRQTNAETFNLGISVMQSTLISMILVSYMDVGFGHSGTPQFILKCMKVLGLSKEEAEALILENLSGSSSTDQRMTRDQLADTTIGKELENYSSLTA